MEFLLVLFFRCFILSFFICGWKRSLWYQFYVTERFKFSRFNFLMYSEHFHNLSRPRNNTYNSVNSAKSDIIITLYLIYFTNIFLLFVRTRITSGYKCRDRERRESYYLASMSSVLGVNISLRVKSHRNESLFSCAKGEETPSNPTQTWSNKW